MPGVEIQATVFLNLIRKEWLTELPLWAEFAIFLVCGCAGGVGFVLVRPWVAARWALLGLMVMTGLGFGLVWAYQAWFPWLICVVVQIPAALIWSVIANSRKLYFEKAVLERTLATARTAARWREASEPLQGLGAMGGGGQERPGGEPVVWPGLRPAPVSAPAVPDLSLIRIIGQGAYGDVWLAQDVLGTYKAVKVVYRNRFHSAAPFDREFRGLQKFTPISRSHPGFVHVLHAGRNEADGYFFAVMELGDDERMGTKVDPETYSPRNLAKELGRRGTLAVSECLSLSVALSDALEHLHQQQLIHRDIKPSNIIFVRGQPKFADIGLVTDIAEGKGDVTNLGTEGYIAPEGPGTPAADVYSLGKVIYEACMGRDRVQFPELPTNLAERPDRREVLQLNDIILKACEVDVSQRYQTAAELKADLVRLEGKISV